MQVHAAHRREATAKNDRSRLNGPRSIFLPDIDPAQGWCIAF
jgi:hypothetical protein